MGIDIGFLNIDPTFSQCLCFGWVCLLVFWSASLVKLKSQWLLLFNRCNLSLVEHLFITGIMLTV